VVSSAIPFVGSGLSFAKGPLQYTTDVYKKVRSTLLSSSGIPNIKDGYGIFLFRNMNLNPKCYHE
jgi:hypothetical protein